MNTLIIIFLVFLFSLPCLFILYILIIGILEKDNNEEDLKGNEEIKK